MYEGRIRQMAGTKKERHLEVSSIQDEDSQIRD